MQRNSKNMHERLEQLVQLHKMCLQEMHQLQANVDHYLQTSTNMVDTIKAHWPQVQRGSGLALMVYDNFLTSITNVMNLSRKFNIQLQLNHPQNSDETHTFDMFDGHREEPNQQGAAAAKYTQENKEICDKSLDDLSKKIGKIDLVHNSKFVYPAEEMICTSKEANEEFGFPRQNLTDFYKVGSTIKAVVTYLKDVDDLKFYIFDFHSEFMDTISEVAQSIDLHQYHTLPPAHEVFGLVLDKRILRAVRSNKVLYDQKMDEQIWPCYLLDFGEVVHLRMGDIKYKLTERQQIIPPLALLCQLKVSGSLKDQQEKLREMEYQHCELDIIEIKEGSIFVVELRQDTSQKTNNPIVATAAKPKEAPSIETNPFKQPTNEKEPYKLTDEELDMLHDEPFCTTNAMTAVMGYNPQDEKRICRFYDPNTGACFKGTSCKQEHVPLHPEGWTKDVLPAISIVDNRSPLIVYPKGSVINVTPTYIGQLGSFYAQINDPHHNNSPLIWNEEDVPAWKRLQRPPHIFELVLSRYEDGLWYRAKILAHDDDYKMFKVFYVDYGNHQIVHLRNMAKCDNGMAHVPFQATLCRLAGVRDAEITPEQRKTGIAKLCGILLNQSVDIRVVSHHEDLIVSFVGEKHLAITNLLIDEGYMNSYKK